MERRNQFSKELMHKSAIASARLVSSGSDPFEQMFESPEYATAIRDFNTTTYNRENQRDNIDADEYRAKRAWEKTHGRSPSKWDKKLANHEWYMHNKRWKQDYNKDYYQRNKDYWVRRYQDVQRSQQLSKKATKELVKRAATGKISVADAIEYARDADFLNTRYDAAELESARINAKRAMQEYQWAERTYGKTPVTELWKAGASSIADAGKKFIQKFKDIPGLRKKSKS